MACVVAQPFPKSICIKVTTKSLAVEDIPKTAIITPFGLFEYLFTPFGLSNAAQTFQRMRGRMVANFEAVFTYMDDTQISSPDMRTHLIHLEALFAALTTHGLAYNLEKCVFAILTLEILGHTISPAGLGPIGAHTGAIDSCPLHRDIKKLQRFLGMVNFYLRFLPGVVPAF
jgi:hypothetical protein